MVMTDWELNSVESTQREWYHPQHPQHRVLVAQAGAEHDHAWYVLLHIGELSPSDARYLGGDRRGFMNEHEASHWVETYLEAHPDGHDLAELYEQQYAYDAETGTLTHI